LEFSGVTPLASRIKQTVSSQTALILFTVGFATVFIWKLNPYTLVGLAVNYFQFGAVRRGFLGAVLYLIGTDLQIGAKLVYISSLILFMILASAFLRRITVSTATRLAFLIILLALVLFWSRDVGRTDMLIASILMMAALAAVDNMIITASLCLAVGLAIHETAVFYGVPVLVAILLDDRRWRTVGSRSAGIAGAITAASLAIFALSTMLPHSDPQTIVDTIRSEIPASYKDDELIDAALYNLVGGTRQFDANICVVWHERNHFINLLVAIFVILLTLFSLSGSRRLSWTAPMLASVPPVLLLWTMASDMSRWVIFSIVNLWIICAVRSFAPAEGEPRWPWARAGCAAAILALIYPGITAAVHLRTRPIFVPSPLIEKAVEIVLGASTYSDLNRCDPTWRSMVTQQNGK
jgi:hypothetical protein